MVNLSLFRHYEVIKRSNNSVRFSLVLIATWAATLLLLLKLSKLTLTPLEVDWDAFASFSVLILLSLVVSMVAGFFGGDAERKNADIIINAYLISNNNTEVGSAKFCELLNQCTSSLEKLLFISNGFNCIATAVIAWIYFYFCKGYINIKPCFLTSWYFLIPVCVFALLLGGTVYWAYFKGKADAAKTNSDKKESYPINFK